MAHRYDSETITFSPDGRIFQIQYAMEAISHSGTVVAVVSSEGIIIIGVKLTSSPFLETINDKILEITSQICCATSGVTSDSSLLIDYARECALEHQYVYDEEIPLQQLVSEVCEIKQNFTQFGGLRPFGVSLVFGGWDSEYGFQLYLTGPSGNYSGWKSTSIGLDSENIQKILKYKYKEDMNIRDITILAFHSIAAASTEGEDIINNNNNNNRLEVMLITRDEKRRKGKEVVFDRWNNERIKEFIDNNKEEIFEKENLNELTL